MRTNAVAWVIAMLGALMLGAAAHADTPIPLALVIAKTTEDGRPALAISLTVPGSASGRTVVRLPTDWASEKELWRGFKALTVKGASFVGPFAEPQTRPLSHAPSAPVTLSWTILQDYQGEPNFLDPHSLFRPTVSNRVVIAALQEILPSLELAPGEIIGLDPHPRTNAPPACDITITFEGFPKDWALATAFGSGAQQAVKELRCDALWDSNIALGDFRVREASDAHGVVRLAVRGKWLLSDEVLLAKFASARAAAGDAFRDPGPSQILVSLAATPPLPKGTAVFGTAFSYGFFGFATPNASLSSLKVWWNHEQVHYWIPNRLGQLPEGSEIALAWFNEGFTEYFSLMTAYRTHELDAKALADEMNERFIAGYLKSPVREAPNAKVVEGFWRDHTVQQLPYQRGALLALNWNAEIKKASRGEHSLADLIGELLDQARQNPNIMLTPSRIAEAARTLGVANAAADIAGFIEAGHLLLPRADVFGPCAQFDTAKGQPIAATAAWASPACAAWLK